MALAAAEKKWAENTLAAVEVWKDMVRRAATYDAFVKGVAAFLGVSESEVRATLPAEHYNRFRENPDVYAPIFIKKVRAAYEAKKWSEKYKYAFTKKKGAV